MEEKGAPFLYENRGMSAGLSFFHIMDLIVGLGDKFGPGAFFYMKRKFLEISRHDPGRSSQHHDLDPAAFQGKGLHDLKGRSIGKVFQYGLALPGTGGNGKAGDFSIGIFFLLALHSLQKYVFLDPFHYLIHMFAAADVREQERTVATHFFGISFHNFQACPYIGSQVDLIDHQQIGTGDPGTSFSGDLVAFCHINDKDGGVSQFRGEGSGKIVSAAFYEKTAQYPEIFPPFLLQLPDSWKRLPGSLCEDSRRSPRR